MKHAFIVPLIGGQAIAQAAAFGEKPSFMQSFIPFADNDEHIRRWWPDVPFDLLDDGAKVARPQVVVVGSTCPCAGLSSLSQAASAQSKVNDWLYTVANQVLNVLKPEVYWGENAPALSSQMGWFVANKLHAIGRAAGYTFSMYRTKSALHGLPQTRQRTFFFFWRRDDGKIPVLPWIQKPQISIEDWFATKRPTDKMSTKFIRAFKPSSMDAYAFLLDHYKCDHAAFVKKLTKTMPITLFLHKHGLMDEAAAWLDEHKSADANNVRKWQAKYNNQSAPFERYLILPRRHIPSFVNPLPYVMAHPFEDRFPNIREMLDMMGLPLNFTSDFNHRNILHITQNVPFVPAFDTANMITQYLEGKLELVDSSTGWYVTDNCRMSHYKWLEERA